MTGLFRSPPSLFGVTSSAMARLSKEFRMISMQRLRIAAFAVAVSALASVAGAQTFNQPGTGKQLFDAMCQDCHGPDGRGDEAPALNHPLMANDDAIKKIIRDGDPARGMPRVRRMTEPEVEVLAAYVRQIGRGMPEKVAGDAGRGRSVYANLDCQTCHVIAGQGGIVGPELTKVGALRAPSFIRKTIVDPAVELPKGMGGILLNGFSEYLPVSVVEKGGREVRGFRVNEDSFTIQVRDADGKYYSFRKGDVQNIDKQTGRSLMSSYRDKLSAAQLDDLVAYLVSLGGPK
jgi:cytochrome c oxidase cbb3-type subunit 3